MDRAVGRVSRPPAKRSCAFRLPSWGHSHFDRIFNFALNEEVVRRMKIEDLRGTDLAAIVEAFAKRITDMA